MELSRLLKPRRTPTDLMRISVRHSQLLPSKQWLLWLVSQWEAMSVLLLRERRWHWPMRSAVSVARTPPRRARLILPSFVLFFDQVCRLKLNIHAHAKNENLSLMLFLASTKYSYWIILLKKIKNTKLQEGNENALCSASYGTFNLNHILTCAGIFRISFF